MAAREELETVLSATDRASDVIDGVADKAEKLEGIKPEVAVDAKDDASDELADIRGKLNRLDKEEAEILLKAETKAARADLRAAQRELIALDGEEGEVEVKADIADAKSRLKAIDQELADLDSTVAQPKIEADAPESSGGRAGSLFSAGAVKAIGAGAIASTIVELFNRGMDRIQMRAKFQNEFGLIKSDAKRLGKEAAEVYEGGWGDSLEAVYDAIGRVNQQLVQTGRVSAEETAKITTDAIAIADVYGEDVSGIIRAVSQLMANDLADSATEATDLIVSGLQDGSNQAGDFFDTIDEYSQHFGAMGLSGADMMSIIQSGFQNGQRDADRLADAVKEMRLRTTDSADAITEAYDRLGLNADKYREKVLAGGDSARTAYTEILAAIDAVEDPIERNALAVELIGTMYEDLGPKALVSLQAIEDGTNDVTGATDELVESQDKATSEASVAWREMGSDLDELGGYIADIGQDWAGWYNDADQGLEKWQRGVLGTTELTGTFKEAIEQTSGAHENFAIRAAGAGDAADSLGSDIDTATESTEEAAAAAEELQAALEAEAEATIAAAEAQLDRVDAQRAAADATFALHDAEDELTETLTAGTETLKDGESTLRDVQQAQDDAAQSAGKLADAALRVAQEQAGAQGSTVNATQALDIQNESMLQSAATAEGPLRDAILGYIGDLNGIPEEELTDIRALIDEGKIAEAETALENASRTRDSTVNAVADTAAAELALANLARPRTTSITTVVNTRTGTTYRDPSLSHVGSRFAAGETKMVVPGQVFTPDVPGRMSSMEESQRMTSGSGQLSGSRDVAFVIQVAGMGEIHAVCNERDARLLAGLAGGVRK